jgi:hypothetical protein
MGRRDEPELTPSDAELVEAETATRELLALYDEPATVEAPPGLAARVLAAMPAAPSPRASRRPFWAAPRPPLAAWAAATVLLLALGALSALAVGPGLGGIAPAPDSLLGRISLALAATPIGPLLVSAGGVAALALLAIGSAAWLWWSLRRRRGDE